MKITKEELFKRQTTLLEVGNKGQQKLLETRVLVVGCGGLGSPIAVGLATSGIGAIHLVDFDTVSLSNLHRQYFYSLEDVGKPKTEVLANFIEERAPFTKISFTNKPLTKNNIFEIVADYDIVVDGTDSLPTKYLINDVCVLKDKPLVYGSLYKFDGYAATFNVLQKDGTRSPNLRDAFPEMATDVPNCEEAGTLNAIVSMIASVQINEILKWILGLDNLLIRQLLVCNFSQNTQLKIALKSSFSKKKIQQIFETETYYDASCEIRNKEWLISSSELKNQLDEVEIISVIANQDIKYPFSIQQNIPLSEFLHSSFQAQENKKYVIVCMKGNSSYTATKFLREKYPWAKVFSLVGGITNF